MNCEEFEILQENQIMKVSRQSKQIQKDQTLADILSNTKTGIPMTQNNPVNQKRIKSSQNKIIVEEKIQIQQTKMVIINGQIQMEPQHKICKKPLELEFEDKKITTSDSFKVKNKSVKWSKEETEKFYQALQIYGIDFEMISNLFTNRNRLQIKNKFQREEKINFEKIELTLKSPQVISQELIQLQQNHIEEIQNKNQLLDNGQSFK